MEVKMLKLIIALVLTLSIAACGLNSKKGANEEAHGSVPVTGPSVPGSQGGLPGQPNSGTTASEPHGLTCPQGFSVVSAGNGGHLCSDGNFALGPFPYAMAQRAHDIIIAMDPYDGTLVPTDYYIQINLAKQAFGSGRCPTGSTFDPDLGFCSDGSSAYGPFTYNLIMTCLNAGGGSACGTTRWSSGFLYSLY
jgi:hypothetical protein